MFSSVESMNCLENIDTDTLHSGSGFLRVGAFGGTMACAFDAKRAVA